MWALLSEWGGEACGPPGNQRLLGRGVIPLGLSFLPQDTRRLRAENADPRLGSRNSPWCRLDYCQHRPRGPSPHGELSPGPGSLHPCPNHPFQLAFLDPVPPGPPRPGPATQGPLPALPAHFPPNIRQAAHPTPKSAREWRQSLGGQREFFFFLLRIDFILRPPSPTVGRGRHKGTPPPPPKERKT